MRPFPAQYIDNYAFYGSFGIGRLCRAPEAPKKGQNFNFILEKKYFFEKLYFCVGPLYYQTFTILTKY